MILIGIVEGLRAPRPRRNDIETAATNGERRSTPAVQTRGQSAEKAEGWLVSLGVLAGGRRRRRSGTTGTA